MSGLAAQQFQNKLMQLAIENANIAKPQYLQIVKEGLYQPGRASSIIGVQNRYPSKTAQK